MQDIQWEQTIENDCLLKGSTTGMFSHVQLLIKQTNVENEYSVHIDHKGSNEVLCAGLDQAKAIGQHLLNNYILSNIFP